MRKNRTILRQGDVLLIAGARIPQSATPLKRDRGRVILAYGEVTGHAHAILEPGAEILTADDVRYLRVDRVSAKLAHEEHSTIIVEPGDYEIRIQREYTPEALRNVAD